MKCGILLNEIWQTKNNGKKWQRINEIWRLTKSHKVIHVRDMRLTDEVQEPEEPLVAVQLLVAEQPLVLEEPVEHDVLAVATEVRSLREKRTRHPPTRASKRKKITDLID